jgi:hypothetical protein
MKFFKLPEKAKKINVFIAFVSLGSLPLLYFKMKSPAANKLITQRKAFH